VPSEKNSAYQADITYGHENRIWLIIFGVKGVALKIVCNVVTLQYRRVDQICDECARTRTHHFRAAEDSSLRHMKNSPIIPWITNNRKKKDRNNIGEATTLSTKKGVKFNADSNGQISSKNIAETMQY